MVINPRDTSTAFSRAFNAHARKFVASTMILFALAAMLQVRPALAQEPTAKVASKTLMVHYMPWFEAKPTSNSWGWHWTMNALDPEKVINGKREIAAHYYPLIGPYDSSDIDVLEIHLLTMKLAGIDGVIVDWYGLTDYRDYAILHRNTTRLLETAERLKMKFAICYEDQTIPALESGKRLAGKDRVTHALSEINWLGKYWFQSPSYLSLNGKPVLLSFGLNGLSDDEWTKCLEKVETPIVYFSQQKRRPLAVGGFDWPIPSQPEESLKRFATESTQWKESIPVAYPRFVDFYQQAKVGKSYGNVPDDSGKRYAEMLKSALESKASIIQIATWNDWSEGTVIEPSVEFQYRELETTLELAKEHGLMKLEVSGDDLRLPQRLFEKRRKDTTHEHRAVLDKIARLISEGKLNEAQALLQ